jgi:CRISPR system Cascade subunit CasE
MYLSRLVLNPRDRQVRQDLADCQGLHRTLLCAFPDGTAGDGAGARARCGLLFRTEQDARTGEVRVLVQSRIEPNWGRLPAGYVQSWACKEIGGSVAGITAGQRLRFRLRANPTRRIGRVRHPGDEQLLGKRVELAREADQLDWLARKGAVGGFRLLTVRARPDVLQVQAAPEGKVTGWRQRDGGTHRLTFGAVLFEGELEVTDAMAFRAALERGIGSGKAYGFGLLSIARPPV